MDKTLAKGLAILEFLATCDAPCKLAVIAQRLGMTKSNVHRLLQTLASLGYVRNVADSGDYALTVKIWSVGMSIINRLDIKSIAGEYLQRLVEATGETVHLSVLNDGRVVYIDKIDSPHPVRAYSMIGGQAPAHCVATGKVLLAYAPEDLVNPIVEALEKFTKSTITDPQRLRRALAEIRHQGYAVNLGEWREGVFGAAAPIFDASSQVVAAVGISGPAERMKSRLESDLVPHVVEQAREISRRLGYQGHAEHVLNGRAG